MPQFMNITGHVMWLAPRAQLIGHKNTPPGTILPIPLPIGHIPTIFTHSIPFSVSLFRQASVSVYSPDPPTSVCRRRVFTQSRISSAIPHPDRMKRQLHFSSGTTWVGVHRADAKLWSSFALFCARIWPITSGILSVTRVCQVSS